jgi:UDP-N-acetylmuramoylalanine--D-glutamate ligase
MTTQEILKNYNSDDAILIYGLGVTGKALAEFCEKKKFRYFITDQNKNLNWEGKYFQGFIDLSHELKGKGIKFMIPSPGVPLTDPLVQKVLREKIPIVGELELASLYLKGDFIAVTGTNGKSTTVKLINELLNDAGVENGLMGNIGFPLISAVSEPPKIWYVIEESSYQLELIGHMRHKVAVCLNVTDDHLDRYAGMAEYAEAKNQIIRNSQAGDWFVFNADDEYCVRMSWRAKDKKMHLLPFSLVNAVHEGACIEKEHLVVRLGGREYKFDLKSCALKGLHNQENMMAAVLAVLVVNSNSEAVEAYRKKLKNFSALPHRVEKVGSFDGVDYYDDSKGTNVGAVVMSLASFDQPVILIAGGKDKNSDYFPLKGLLKGKVKKLILLGEAKEKMYQALKDSVDTTLVDDMKAAVKLAHNNAVSGDVVLLSPACSSFDQYQNYKERGLDFQTCIKNECRR